MTSYQTIDKVMKEQGLASYEQAANFILDNMNLFTEDQLEEASYFLLRMMVEDG
jgi:hypothetical protein